MMEGGGLGDRAVTWAFAKWAGHLVSVTLDALCKQDSPSSTEENIRAHVASLRWWPQAVASVMVGGVSVPTPSQAQ